MNNAIKHFVTICKHKWYVGIECWKRGLYWQGLVHDMSKFSPTEFMASARYFQGTGSPIEAEKAVNGYSLAWMNHKAKNKHHWIYWIDQVDGEWVGVEMPTKYVQEMLCDYIGAGKAYNTEKWTPKEPLSYYNSVDKDRMLLHPNTRYLFTVLLESLSLEQDHANN